MEPADLLHEALLRIASGKSQFRFQNIAHLIAVTTLVMRRVLIDRARCSNYPARHKWLPTRLPDAPACGVRRGLRCVSRHPAALSGLRRRIVRGSADALLLGPWDSTRSRPYSQSRVGRLNATGRLREVGCVTRLGNRLGAQSGGRALWRIHARVQPGRHAATLASAPQTNGCRPSLTTSSSANRHDTNTPQAARLCARLLQFIRAKADLVVKGLRKLINRPQNGVKSRPDFCAQVSGKRAVDKHLWCG